MRLLAAVSTILLLGAAAVAGLNLWALMSPDPAPDRVQAQLDQPAQETRPSADKLAKVWPALFGEPQPPEPSPPAQQPNPEPKQKQPPTPPKPPLDSLGYVLSGIVKSDDGVWAMVDHPTGGRLLRIGEELQPGITVSRIDAEGLWISRDGDAPELLGFPEQPGR